MRLRVTSDGTGATTFVRNADTGELLEGVQHVHWSCDLNGLPKLVVAVSGPTPADLVIDDAEEP